jgi:hypothetical protein
VREVERQHDLLSDRELRASRQVGVHVPQARDEVSATPVDHRRAGGDDLRICADGDNLPCACHDGPDARSALLEIDHPRVTHHDDLSVGGRLWRPPDGNRRAYEQDDEPAEHVMSLVVRARFATALG